jgi:tetratricopeptide (TPR) repeat protein
VVGGIWWRKNRRAALLLLFSAAFLLPVLNLVPLNIHVLVSERFLYLPLFGVALLAALGLEWLMRRGGRWWLLGPGLLACSWALTANARSVDFTDNLRFWRSEVAASTSNPLAEMSLAQALIERRQFAEAEQWLRRSMASWNRSRRHPEHAVTLALQLVKVRLAQTTDQDVTFRKSAASFLEKLLQFSTVEPRPEQRASLKLGQQWLLLEVNTKTLREALVRKRGMLLSIAGRLHSQLEEDERAEQELRQAGEVAAPRISTLFALALVQARRQNIAGAWETFQTAQRLVPEAPRLVSLRGMLAQAGERIAALRALLQHTDRKSQIQVQQRLAELYLITQAPRRAMRHLRQVIELDPGNRQARAMLALELAARGDRSAALAVIEQARSYFGEEPGLQQLRQHVSAMSVRPQDSPDDFWAP